MSSSTAPVLLHREGAVAWLTLNRPAALNALDIPTANAFLACCEELAADTGVRAVVLKGEGKTFGVGGDLAALRHDAAATAMALIEPLHRAVLLLTSMDAPVIASLHGSVAGGSMSLSMACDLAIAADTTRFNLAYVNVAANCDVSGSWHLPRLVGLRNAMAIALLGDSFDAAEALRLGLVNRVVPAVALQEETDALARPGAGDRPDETSPAAIAGQRPADATGPGARQLPRQRRHRGFRGSAGCVLCQAGCALQGKVSVAACSGAGNNLPRVQRTSPDL
jgi:2-(1,2-epoxy-1,2-dihydrophenyl)acetyl-CoA isomerase